MYLPFVKRHVLTSATLCVSSVAIMLTGFGGTAQARNPQARAFDTTATAERARPRFYVLQGWEGTADSSASSTREPTASAIEHLCRFYDRTFDATSPMWADRSPLEWPRILAEEFPDAGRQRREVRALLDYNGLSFREVIPLDIRPGALADTIAASLTLDHPVLFNSPDAAVVYGFDYREPDHWWWLDRAGVPEIVLESQRTAQFTYWSDDPTAGVIWPVTGGFEPPSRSLDSLEWTFLKTVVQSVQGDPAEGIAPYPLTLRRFRELLASSDSLPRLLSLPGGVDPLGIRRATSAREHLIGVIQGALAGRPDTSGGEPLRLAEYHIHSVVTSLMDMAAALYGNPDGFTSPDSLAARWGEIRPRRRALEMMSELIKSEKLALESLQIAIAAREKTTTPAKPASEARRRGR